MSEPGLRQRAAATLAPLDRPLTSYYLIITCTSLLLAIGLVMVLSTSSASQLDSGQSPYSVFVKQLLGAVFGLAMMWLLSKTPPRLFRTMAYPLLLAAIGSLVLVLAFGTSQGGAERWISVTHTGIKVQPSEFAKLAFLLWGADLLARKEKLRALNDWRTLLIPLLPGAAVVGLLVILGDDLGTTFLLLVILLALLWVVGTPARMFVGILGLVMFALVILTVVVKYRSNRLSGYLDPTAGGPTGKNMQAIQGRWAIGSGGLFGVGLGNGTAKWDWVPEASTDFIFAILGEELGLIGTACVVLLYGGLAFAGLRVARRVRDPFMRFAATGAVAWIVGQALVNIGAVVGLIPITGVPLPLISQGLSSVIATMAAIGLLLSFARSEPGARQALAAGRPWIRAMLPAGLRRASAAGSASPQAARSRPGPRPAGQRLASQRPAGQRQAGARMAGQRAARDMERSAGLSARSGSIDRSGPSRLTDPGSRPGGAVPGGRPGSPGPGGRPGPAGPAGRPAQASPAGRSGPARQTGRPGPQDSWPRASRPPDRGRQAP